ncbi:MAG TPA: hypothetical protein VIF09_26115 [Polyangiaceae bacterium]
MNPYASPGASPAGGAEDDIAAATPPVLAKAAGGVIALAGAVVGLTGVQTLMIVNLRGPFAAAPYVLALLGVANVFVGAVVFRARVWGALCALGGTLLGTLLSAVWLVFSIGHGLLSLYALGAPVVSTAALVFAILALGPCQRASAARERLRAQGMNLGI